MALQLAEKLGGLVENNERVFDLKQGVYGGYFNRGKYYWQRSSWRFLIAMQPCQLETTKQGYWGTERI